MHAGITRGTRDHRRLGADPLTETPGSHDERMPLSRPEMASAATCKQRLGAYDETARKGLA